MQATLTLNGELSEILAFFKSAPVESATLAANVEPAIVNNEPTFEEGSLDAKNLPWDSRIHATNKTRNEDNTWRKRRGVDPLLVAQVESELRGGTVFTVADTVPQDIVVENVASEPLPMTFKDFMGYISPKFNSQGHDKIDPGYVSGVCDYILVRTGTHLAHIGELNAHPHLIPIAIEKFQADGKW